MIDVHLLRYMLAAADTGSFSQAAQRFGIKQSTLSQHILNFELRSGLSLFERSTRGVTPTDLGHRLLRRASRILEDIDALGSECKALAAGSLGTLRLGLQGSLMRGDLAAIVRDYRSHWPDVELSAVEQDRTKLLDAVERERLDLAITTGEQSRPGIQRVSYWREPVCLGLAPDHPLATSERIYWTDLRRERFVVTASDPGSDLAALILSRLSGPGHQPQIVTQRVSLENLPSFATTGQVSVSLGPSGDCTGACAITKPVHDAFGPTMIDQYLYWRPDNPNPALGHFLALVANRYGRFPARSGPSAG